MDQFKRSFALAMSFLLVFGNASLSFANDTSTEASKDAVELAKEALQKEETQLEKATPELDFEEDDKVRVVVELFGETPLEYANKKGVQLKEVSESKVDTLTAELVDEQKAVKANVQKEGVKVDYTYSYTTAFNGFAGEVEFGQVEKLKNVDGVKEVYLSNEYNRPEITPDMTTSHDYIQSAQTWGDAGYEGEGMVVAVIDSGIDPSHKDFVLDSETEEDLTEAEVNDIVGANGFKGKYFTEKVPYGYNYYDNNQQVLDIGPDASMHGMHVSGTVVANGDTENGGIKGVAPEAQVLGMKVFSNDPLFPSTFSDVYLAAIDEAIALGADVLNMSLGSTASFYEENSPEDIAITRAVENGVVAAVSAGNSGHIADGWDNPFYENPDIGVVGAPGLNTDTIQVAATGNTAFLYEHNLEVGSTTVPGYGIDDWSELADLEIVSLSQLKGVTEETGKSCKVCGTAADYEGLEDEVAGKVVLVKRGTLSFYDKTEFAAAAGAKAIIVYSHGLPNSGFFYNQGGWSVPFAMVTLEDGEALEAEIANNNDALNVTQTSKEGDAEMGRMTDFTSWGTTPSLELKPEISAPGGKIYSTLNDDEYGVMSGTSMASPHVAGGAALVQQYLQTDEHPFGELDAEERTRLAKALLMNTAYVIEDLYGQPFSPRRQGAGMMQTYAAVSTPTVLLDANSNEAKVELKDFTDEKFSMTLTAMNASDEELTYAVNVDVLADSFAETDGPTYNSLMAGDLQDVVVDAPETVTVPAGEAVEFTVDVDISNAKVVGFDKDNNEKVIDLPHNSFVEGFVTLDAEGVPSLSLPYVGFYGEWAELPIVDGLQELGESVFYDNGFPSSMLEGAGYFVSPVQVDGKEVFPLSPNGDGDFDDIYPILAFLRNAEEVQYNVVSAEDKTLRTVRIEKNVRKTYFDAGNGSSYSFNSARAWNGLVDNKVVKDGLYYYEVKSVIGYEGAKWQSKKLPVYVDTTAPVVEASVEGNKISWTAVEEGVGVNSAVVVVNGTPTVIPAGESSYTFDSLNKSDVIEVVVVDHAFNAGSDKVVAEDTVLPLIYFNTPDAASAYNTKNVQVSGYVEEDIALASIEVYGKSVEFTKDEQGDYQFDTTVTFEKDGKYDIQVVATDVAGNEFSIVRTVYVDTTAPNLEAEFDNYVSSDVTQTDITLMLKDNFNDLTLTLGDSEVHKQSADSLLVLEKPANETVEVSVDLSQGENVFTFALTDVAGNTTMKDVTVYRAESDMRVDRLAGADRYKTAVEVSGNWESSDTVVLARGDNYADALAGVPLAAKYDAPLLLTETDKLAKVTHNEIVRLGAKTVYVLGGEKAVGADVVKSLKSEGITVKRIAGTNRFDTAAKIADIVAPNGTDEAVVVNGKNFPDALSVASYAGSEGMPILLTDTDSLPKETAKALDNLNVFHTVVVGGKAVVTDHVLAKLPDAERVAGGDRYATSVAVAEFFETGSEHYYVATGKSFADALAGSALAAQEGTGILLVGDNIPSSVKEFVTSHDVETITVLGGTSVVTPAVQSALNDLLD
ncbi:hypothetical protein Q75_15435 [Bacillus coahuilensis p1.1.43]|uniref:Lactocepin n=1 Tax=Bacillus coahuilensis p1.1.43 TaxID=1150625 RepID=A0A147K4N1_9BACI|nr:cell wall-binding repeat-containing protein [Bacillus coahuilensis]KUP04390.1 hypothetical protein Q75_15435 [Bacillus coahuilensis p1.1.43]